MLHAARRTDFRQAQLIRRQHAEMNELMAVTAHDLRSPLLGVKNLLTLALARSELARERLLVVIDDAARACDRMLGLVSGLVEAHAVEAAVALKLEAGDLRAPVESAVKRVQPVAAAKGQRVELTLPSAAAGAMFDAGALGQILDNLLGNALKFSPPGSVVYVRVTSVPGGWRIEVADRGPGVPQEERARLFRKHARGSASPTGGEASSGLGLFIVKTLAGRMSAQAGHTPRAGGGSVFHVEWPAT
jgi:signal transduction histidine kinase